MVHNRSSSNSSSILLIWILKMNTKEKIIVMQAFVDGKQIQRCGPGGIWEDLSYEPHWDWCDFGYRIKPNLKLNPDFKRHIPTDEDREEEIQEMKDSVIDGVEGDR